MLTEQERKIYTKMAPILLSILFIINLFLFLVIMPLDHESPLDFFATAKLSRHYEEIAIYLILRPLLAGIVTFIVFY